MPRAVNLSERFKILARDNFRCVYCGATPQDAPLHIDHVYPRSKGGADRLSNYVTACFNCNVGKSDMVLEEIVGRSEFINAEWLCNAEGIEHRRCEYFIEAERLNEIATYVGPWCSEWLKHVANKDLEIESFIEAFYQAFLVTGTPIRFDWRRSVDLARRKKEYSKVWEAEWERRLIERHGKVPLLVQLSDFALMDDWPGFNIELERAL